MRKTISFVLAGVFALGLITSFGSEADAAITKEQEQLLQAGKNPFLCMIWKFLITSPVTGKGQRAV